MVKKFFGFLNKEISGLHEAAYLLAFFALLSQVLGLLRDRLLAYSFGAGHVLDVYYAAFRIPDFVYVSIASMVSISVLVPFLIEKIDKNKVEAKEFIDDVFSVFFFAIIAVAVILFVYIPSLIPLVLPGFANDPLLPDLIVLSRILLLSPILLGISNFFASITQIYNRFLIYAISPLLYNVGIIFGILVLYPLYGIHGLGYGVAFGAFLHVFIQIPFVIKQGLFPRIKFKMRFESISRIIYLSLPRTLTLSANQISAFVLVGIASVMNTGSIAIFNLAINLQSVPLSIIGVSYSSAAFPALTRLLSNGNRQKFVEKMIESAQHIIFWATPITILFIVLRAQIVRTILGAGQFNWNDTRLTAAALALFTVSAVAQSLMVLFIRAYYSGGKTWKPLVINVFAAILTVVFGFVFLNIYNASDYFRFFIEALFRVSDVPGTSVLVLPLAYSLGVLINLIIHWIAFHREFRTFSKPVLRTFFQIAGSSMIMGYVAHLFLNVFDNVFNISTTFGIFMQGFCAGIIGIIMGIVVLKLLDNRELEEISHTLRRKIWKAKVIVPEQEQLQ